MNLFSLNNSGVFLIICCLIICFLIARAGSQSLEYLPDDLFISCGSHGIHTEGDSTEWIGDANPKFTNLLQIKGSSTTSRAADPVPYTTARISRSQFSYAFHLEPGQKLIRLYFNSIQYGNKLQDLFSVEAGSFLLLSDFSPSITANTHGTKSVVKEFYLSVEENKELEIVFSAESGWEKQTYAFINGIKIISVVPLHLCNFDGGIKVVGQNSLAYVDNTMAQETVYRVRINRVNNTCQMQAAGEQRGRMGINQMNWNLSVDLGFTYLVRLHFCEVCLRNMNFTFLINEMIAASTDDVFKESDYSGTLLYGNRMVIIKGPKQQGKRDLLISLLWNAVSVVYEPIKVFEIFKLSNPYNSLASHNPLPRLRRQPSRAWHSLFSAFWERYGTTVTVVTIMTLINIIVHCLEKFWEAKRMEERMSVAMCSRPCRQFSLVEMQLATRNFSNAHVIGKDGYSIVYKGIIDHGRVAVTIKRLKPCHRGRRELLAEIKILSKLQHVNLVSLIGYCFELQERMLVYEYMPGTLADHLYKLDMDSSDRLSWEQRLRICIDVAKALDYLHTDYGVAHYDIKASNILLDENSVAKISDFGLVKLLFTSDQVLSHVSTIAKSAIRYLDPNYVSNGKKIDVYSFGVVLLEVLCGRPTPGTRAGKDRYNITTWARELMRQGKVDMIVDSNVREESTPESLEAFMAIVERCLNTEEPSKRPNMAQVVLMLELALQQQQIRSSLVPKEISSVALDAHPSNNVKAPTSADQRPGGYLASELRYKEPMPV